MEKPLNVKSELNGETVAPPSPLPRNKDVEVPSVVSDLDPGDSTSSFTHTGVDESDCEKPAMKDDSLSKEDPIDSESIKGIFGWETLDGTSIPYLLRRGKKYVSIRIIERKLLSKYPNKSPDELGKKDPLVSHFITEAEANLLNEINVSHCDYEYGNSSFTKNDLVVDLEEFNEFFKLVKKTFPEEVLATMKGDVSNSPKPAPTPPESTSTPPASTPPPTCGWIQINNTVSPYIIRGAGKNRVKLVPLSVIVYAAGLLTNTNVKGLLPSSEECRMLNAACKAAGFDFTFARNTRLISLAMVVERCQVQMFELPVSNPLQHAQYLDQRMAPPTMPVNPALRQPPPPPYPGFPMMMEGMVDRPPFFMNPFLSRFPGQELPPSVRPVGMVPPATNFDIRQPVADQKLSNLDPSHLPANVQQALLDKCHRLENAAAMNTMNKIPPNLRPPFWSMIPGQPPPAHSGKLGMTSKTPPSPFDPSLLSSTASSSQSSYQPVSLPPNPLLHSTPLDLNHPIYRMQGLQSPSTQDSNPQLNSKQGPSPLHQLNQGSLMTSSFGTNQFNSSLFARNDSMDSKKSTTTTQPVPSVITSLHHQPSSQSTNTKRQTPSPSQRKNNNITTNNHKSNLVRCISASLVNGKSISCLEVDSATRKGKYCLVEAVSKLYFPAVPIAEFLKVLKEVLNAKLYSCTPEEEAAFVQYYNLPAPRLKCNQMILVDDLMRYFPQLNYVFSKRNTNHVPSEEANGDRVLKRVLDSASSGPPMKQAAPENIAQKMNSDRKPVAGEGTETTNGGKTASVIVIDD